MHAPTAPTLQAQASDPNISSLGTCSVNYTHLQVQASDPTTPLATHILPSPSLGTRKQSAEPSCRVGIPRAAANLI